MPNFACLEIPKNKNFFLYKKKCSFNVIWRNLQVYRLIELVKDYMENLCPVLVKFGNDKCFEKAGNKMCCRNLWNEAILRESPTHMLSFAADVLKYKSCVFYLEISLDMSQDYLPLLHFQGSG